MRFFTKRPFCSECGVVFEPRKDAYPDLCLPHARPRLDKDWRIKQVTAWASANWERLEPQMKKEQEDARTAFNEAMKASVQAQAEAMRSMPMNQIAGYGGNVLPGMFGGMFPLR